MILNTKTVKSPVQVIVAAVLVVAIVLIKSRVIIVEVKTKIKNLKKIIIFRKAKISIVIIELLKMKKIIQIKIINKISIIIPITIIRLQQRKIIIIMKIKFSIALFLKINIIGVKGTRAMMKVIVLLIRISYFEIEIWTHINFPWTLAREMIMLFNKVNYRISEIFSILITKIQLIILISRIIQTIQTKIKFQLEMVLVIKIIIKV